MHYLKHIIIECFSDVTFNEEYHKYSLKTSKEVLKASVSNLVDIFVDKVDFTKKSYEIDKRKRLPNGTTKKQWEKISQEACDRGTRVHLFGEHYPFNKSLVPSCNQEKAVTKFWETVPSHVVPYMMELAMYHKDYLFGGMLDSLLYNKETNKFIIADYKTNKDLFKNFKNKKLLAPFDDLLDCNYNKYQIQLSFYQILFEQTGLEVSHRKLIHLKKDGSQVTYDTKDFTGILREYLKLNKVC